MDDLEIFQQKTVIAGWVYSHTPKVFSSNQWTFIPIIWIHKAAQMNLLNITTDQKGKPGLTRTTHLHEEESPAHRDSIMVLFLHTNPMASNPHWYSSLV
jgi:hypothetical protein